MAGQSHFRYISCMLVLFSLIVSENNQPITFWTQFKMAAIANQSLKTHNIQLKLSLLVAKYCLQCIL